MKPGDIVMVSDFAGDIETIGVRAIFVGMTEDGQYQTRPITPEKWKKDFIEWRYCQLYVGEVEV